MATDVQQAAKLVSSNDINITLLKDAKCASSDSG